MPDKANINLGNLIKNKELDIDYIEQWAARLGLCSLWKEMLDNIS